jgi:hypothetical protein
MARAQRRRGGSRQIMPPHLSRRTARVLLAVSYPLRMAAYISLQRH